MVGVDTHGVTSPCGANGVDGVDGADEVADPVGLSGAVAMPGPLLGVAVPVDAVTEVDNGGSIRLSAKAVRALNGVPQDEPPRMPRGR